MTRVLRFANCRRGGAATLVVALLTVGCLGRSPEVRQYTLDTMPGRPVATDASRLAIGLGPVNFPPYLRRPQLVTRGGENDLIYNERHRWAGGFESNVRRALADGLSGRLGTPWVVLAPEESPYPISFRIAVDILRFEAQPDQELVLRARWVIRESGGQRVWSGGNTIRRSLDGADMERLVSAHEEALGELADAIASPLAGVGSATGSPAEGSRP